MKNRAFPAQYHPKTSLNLPSKQYWLDLAKPKNAFSQAYLGKWMWLRVWFLHCLMSLHPEMCLFANRRTYSPMHVPWTYLCVPVLFTDNARCWFTIPQYGFPQAEHTFCLYFLYRVHSSFLYCSSFVMLCNRQSIAKTKCNGPPHFQLVGARIQTRHYY